MNIVDGYMCAYAMGPCDKYMSDGYVWPLMEQHSALMLNKKKLRTQISDNISNLTSILSVTKPLLHVYSCVLYYCGLARRCGDDPFEWCKVCLTSGHSEQKWRH